jgi:hypothetical protein
MNGENAMADVKRASGVPSFSLLTDPLLPASSRSLLWGDADPSLVPSAPHSPLEESVHRLSRYAGLAALATAILFIVQLLV